MLVRFPSPCHERIPPLTSTKVSKRQWHLGTWCWFCHVGIIEVDIVLLAAFQIRHAFLSETTRQQSRQILYSSLIRSCIVFLHSINVLTRLDCQFEEFLGLLCEFHIGITVIKLQILNDIPLGSLQKLPNVRGGYNSVNHGLATRSLLKAERRDEEAARELPNSSATP